MKEIKFRGKRVDNGEWVYGFYIYDALYDSYEIIANEPTGGDGYHEPGVSLVSHQVDPDTIGQFSGYHDKNGREIYAGDKVQLIDNTNTLIQATCEFGIAQRYILDNLVDISCFYFRRLSDGKKTFPIVINYIGKHDLDIMEIIDND